MRVPSASRQIAFHQLLVGARKKWLLAALAETLAKVDPVALKRETARIVPKDAQRILAEAGIRDEHVFPTPLILEAQPSLVGYYRLLLGAPQKSFYSSGSGLSRFKSMEVNALLTPATKAMLPEFCAIMSAELAELVRQLSPKVTSQDVHDLPLLTIGSQFQGGENNSIGKKATVDVFLAIAEIVKASVTERTDTQLTIRNAAGRVVLVTLGQDPDVKIQEEVSGRKLNKVAIEIKGGTDKSNAHNRSGEAEKSHLKARKSDFRDFWTIISKKGLNMGIIRSGSPTTTSWFDVSEIVGRNGEDFEEFKGRISDAVGIAVGSAPTKRTKRKKR